MLRRKARPLSRGEIRSQPVQQLIDWMRETMRDAPGVGLAAPQVGLSLRIAVIEDSPESMRGLPPERLAEHERSPVPFHVVVNPRIRLSGPAVEFFEGCLSMPGYSALVSRSRAARVDCLNHRGDPVSIRAAGWYARILQHEIDHLNGVIYIDRMATRSLATTDNLTRYWKNRPIEQIRAEFSSVKPSPSPASSVHGVSQSPRRKK